MKKEKTNRKYITAAIASLLVIAAIFIVAAGDVIVDKGNMNVNDLNVNGKAGIGTASPGGALHVAKASDMALGYGIIAEKGDNAQAYQYSVAGFWGGSSSNYKTLGALGAVVGGNKIGVYGKGTDASGNPIGYAGYFIGDVYTSGKVGIGTLTPGDKLHIKDGSIIVEKGTIGGAGRVVMIGGHQYEWYPDGSSAGSLGLYDRTLGKYDIVISPTGNVGIGTTTPGATLHVKGSVKIESSLPASQGLCLKSDKTIGTCRTVLNSTGGCTCA